MARDRGADALSCIIGAECKSHNKASMKLYRLTQAEDAQVRDIVAGPVLAEWAAECAKKHRPCAAEWDRTVGRVAGIRIAQ